VGKGCHFTYQHTEQMNRSWQNALFSDKRKSLWKEEFALSWMLLAFHSILKDFWNPWKVTVFDEG
jgi:hypothetical protein